MIYTFRPHSAFPHGAHVTPLRYIVQRNRCLWKGPRMLKLANASHTLLRSPPHLSSVPHLYPKTTFKLIGQRTALIRCKRIECFIQLCLPKVAEGGMTYVWYIPLLVDLTCDLLPWLVVTLTLVLTYIVLLRIVTTRDSILQAILSRASKFQHASLLSIYMWIEYVSISISLRSNQFDSYDWAPVRARNTLRRCKVVNTQVW